MNKKRNQILKDSTSISPKPVIIHYNNKSYFEKKMIDEGFEVLNAYKKTNFVTRNIRKYWFKFNFPFSSLWFNKQLKNINIKEIIIWDPVITENFVRWVRRCHPKKRIIFWYWNPAKKSLNPEKLTESVCEKWTYSLSDAHRYNMKYNATFYFSRLKAPQNEVKYDILFIGKDKGRLNELVYFKTQFESLGLKPLFHISPTKRIEMKKNSMYKSEISYDKVLDMIGSSKAILDILTDPYEGLSLRPMESIFHRKKLITNSLMIQNYDFYDSNNIFILGKNDLNILPDFLESPYKDIEPFIVGKYDFSNWIKGFSRE